MYRPKEVIKAIFTAESIHRNVLFSERVVKKVNPSAASSNL